VEEMNKCKYYPCHNLQNMDCSLCYCPFYGHCEKLTPIQRVKNGIAGYWLDRSASGQPKVWACELCEIPHVKEVAEAYKRYKPLYRSTESLFEKCMACYNNYVIKCRRRFYRMIVNTKKGWVALQHRYLSEGSALAHAKELKHYPEFKIEEVSDEYQFI
jgi:Zn-finger protein